MGRLDSALRPLPPLLIVTGQLDHAADSGPHLPAHVIRRPALAAAQDSPSAVSVQTGSPMRLTHQRPLQGDLGHWAFSDAWRGLWARPFCEPAQK